MSTTAHRAVSVDDNIDGKRYERIVAADYRPAYYRTLEDRLGLGGRVAIDLGLGATFTPRAIGVEVKEYHRSADRTPAVNMVALTVYGTADYRGNHDSGASVTINYHVSDGRVTRWSRSNMWDADKCTFVELPEGRRKRLTAAVQALLGDVNWKLLSDEQQRYQLDLAVERQAARVEREIETLEELKVASTKFFPVPFLVPEVTS